jgi:hypothetical protein
LLHAVSKAVPVPNQLNLYRLSGFEIALCSFRLCNRPPAGEHQAYNC